MESANGAPAAMAQRPQSSGVLPYDKLLRPEQVPTLPINEDQRPRFHSGITGFWHTINNKPKEDPSHREAVAKLSQLTLSLMRQAQERTLNKPRQPPEQAEPQQKNNQSLQVPQQDQEQGKPQSQPMARPPSQGQSLQGGQNNATFLGQLPPWSEIPEAYRAKVEGVTWHVPPGIANPQQYKDQLKIRYAGTIYIRDTHQQKIQVFDAKMQQLRSQNQEVPQSALDHRQNLVTQVAAAEKFVRGINEAQQAYQKQYQSQQAARNAASGQVMPTNSTTTPSQPNGSTAPNVQTQQRPPSQSANTDALRQQQQQLNRQAPAGSPAPSQQPNSAAVPPQQPQFARPQQPTQNATGPFSQQSPPSSMPTSSQGPTPFTQQNPMDTNARSYSNASLPQQPVSAGGQQFSTPNADKPNASSKWPMSKNFTPQAPSAVQMGPMRPTMAGPNNGPMGPLGQPAIQQTPSYNLHGPGDHVLDKKKLDELVRQVCGAAEGPSAQGLHPEVEESILELADEFFDNVVTCACKLAKLRGSNMLEIRDIQLVLQRQYNIRIPGYSSDEVRTVRKVQPTASFLQKMNAIQAAKVMGGKGDL